jgi:PAS domain S-box-containing protein
MLAAAACAAPVRVGLYAVEPYATVTSDGQVGGLYVELLNALAVRNGWQLQYVPGSQPLCLSRLSQGDVDLVAPIAWSAENAARYELNAQSLLTTWAHVYVARGQPLVSLRGLRGKTVALVKYDPSAAAFRALAEQSGVVCEFVEFSHYDRVIEVVRNRWVDAGLVDRLYGARHAELAGLRRTSVISPPLQLRFAARRGASAALLAALDEGLEALQADADSPYYAALEPWKTERVGSRRPFPLVLFVVMALLLAGVLAAALVLRQRLQERIAELTTRVHSFEREIAEERTVEASLKSRENWHWVLFNGASDVVFAHGVSPDGLPGLLLEANDAACRRFGLTRDDLLKISPLALEVRGAAGTVPAFSKEDLVTLSAEAIAARGQYADSQLPLKQLREQRELVQERTYRTGDGRTFPAEVTMRLIEIEGRPVVLCTARDVTERRTTVDALRDSERRFRDFFNQSPIGMAIFDSQHRPKAVNAACLRMYAVATHEEFGRLKPFDDAALTDPDRKTLLKGGTVRFETRVEFDRLREDLKLATSRTGHAHLDVMITNLGLDAEFNPKGYLMHVQDVTEQRRAEEALQARERQLRQSQKMEAIGTLAGGIAHDFNNLLTPIMGYTEMAVMSEPETAVRQYLDEVLKASRRARDLVQQILTFSRQSDKALRPVRFGPILKEVLKLLRASLPATVEIRQEIRTERDGLQADPTEIHQVLMNLCTNAAHAMRERGGVLTVQLNELTVDRFARGELARLAPGPYLELVVSDTGAGMDKATQERIFEPFFTTKKSGEGSGMGLSVVHGIVTALKGLIAVESEPGKGTTFRLFFPRLEEAPAPAEEAAQAVPGGTERVLFVDDEPNIAQLMQELLTSLGYRATVFTSSPEALQAFRADPGAFDLVITDQLMPQLNGSELAREVTRLRPGLPVILCTGFSRTLSQEEAEAVGITEHIMKPVVVRQLAEALRRALDGAAARAAPDVHGSAAREPAG